MHLSVAPRSEVVHHALMPTIDKAQVRLDKDVEASLNDIRRKCPWPVSLPTLANYVIRHGMASATKAFAPTKKSGK